MKALLFDLNNTVYNIKGLPPLALHSYLEVIEKTFWEPFLPSPTWLDCEAHPDADEGLIRLRTKFQIVTLSNNPMWMQIEMARNTGLDFDAIIPLELRHIYKPNPMAYQLALDVLSLEGPECGMVTANKCFGDIEQAEHLGMQTFLLNRENGLDLIALAESLGC